MGCVFLVHHLLMGIEGGGGYEREEREERGKEEMR